MKKAAAKLLVVIILSACFFSMVNTENHSDDNDTLIEVYHDETFHEISN